MAVFALSGWGTTVQPSGPENRPAAAGVRALSSGEELPADLTGALGYEPALIRLTSGTIAPVAPEGGCSSPFGGSPYHFTDACRQHDLGYDLLRYADSEGQPLGPWARRAIDARFASELFGQCSDPGCWAMASLYVGAVEFNSWRQGYGVPGLESLVQLLGPVLAGVLVGSAVWLLLSRPWNSARGARLLALAGAR
ncbi:phospholipase [Kineosporia babensis]|uniref:Phospholipase n=1 Tax=Kineosporia babensis TaxID=499548 RepID=A0A9X1SV00_9ACTN|nr:phospholipase [Kineosporia babensis]MCD5313452.1 phospholipase [Kineosporia babensis]